jgi:hypothetical protein
MAQEVPSIALNNGVEMPSIGLGVFQTPPDETRSAAAAALDTGYRPGPGQPAVRNRCGEQQLPARR